VEVSVTNRGRHGAIATLPFISATIATLKDEFVKFWRIGSRSLHSFLLIAVEALVSNTIRRGVSLEEVPL